jgi:hypothetical protein
MSISVDKIYVDLDGVIADFHKRYREKYHITPESADKKGEFGKFFVKFIADREFETLELMKDATELLNFLNDMKAPKEILSSTARVENHSSISSQKNKWLKYHKINYVQNFVPGKHLKYSFATPNSIIIDDTQSVIDDWNKAGGIGIHHTDAKSTIAMLKKYI